MQPAPEISSSLIEEEINRGIIFSWGGQEHLSFFLL